MATAAANPSPQQQQKRPSRILVIGAGFAGVTLAIDLAARGDGAFDVTLVDKKAFFEVVFANARALVEPSVGERAVIGIDELKPHGTFVRGEVVALETNNTARLASGAVIEFDYCAICTGSSGWGKGTGDAAGDAGGAAGTAAARREELRKQHAALKAAPAVVVAGGGSLGVELAGEVARDYPGKKLVLVHGGDRLLPTLPPRAHALAYGWLRAHGCEVVLNDRVAAAVTTQPGRGQAGGRELPAGALVLWATGARPNTEFLAKGPLAGLVDPSTGRVRVRPTLQVVGCDHIFACGDACDVDEEKLAYLATEHGPHVAAVIAALAGGGDGGGGKPGGVPSPAPLPVWRPGLGRPRMMLVTLGRDWGIMRLGGLVVGGWLFSKIKSIDAFVSKYRARVCAAACKH